MASERRQRFEDVRANLAYAEGGEGDGDHDRLLGQDAVDLTQLFPVYTNTIVRLLLGCTVDPINPGFKVVMLAFQKV